MTGLAELEWDVRRKVPIPYMNRTETDEVNFTAISYPKVIECGRDHLCGICHKPLTYWIAFVGGPLSLQNRVYSDPPFHKECAVAAMTYCPHIRVRNHRRTPDEKQPDDFWAAPEAVFEKPDSWIIALARGYKMFAHAGGLLFQPDTIKHSLKYTYNSEGILVPDDGNANSN